MSDPSVGVDFPLFHQFNDLREIFGQRVARTHDRHLTPMHQRMRKRHMVCRDADVDQFPCKRYEFQRPRHAELIARRVDDRLAKIAAG